MMKRRRWDEGEVADLTDLFNQAGGTPDWDELAKRLGTGRNGKTVQQKCTDLGLRDRVARAAPGEAGAGGWEAQRGKSRVAAASTLTSPVGVPPSEPRLRRKAAEDGEAQRQDAELEAKRQALPLTAASLLPESAQRLAIFWRNWTPRRRRNGTRGRARSTISTPA